jgi:hypothetical protein
MHPERFRDVVLADTSGHQQQRFSSTHDTLLGLGRADRRFDRLTLLGRERQRRRSGARVRSRHPRLRIDHALVDTGLRNPRPNFRRAALVAVQIR